MKPGPGKKQVGKYVEPWDRALRFLVEHGHDIGNTDGYNIIVDHSSYLTWELPDLADRLHHEEWIASENAFLDNLLRPKSATSAPGN